MISDERLRFKLKNPDICTGDEVEMAKELLALRKVNECNHEWFTLHYGRTEAIYGCKLCGKYKTGQGSY